MRDGCLEQALHTTRLTDHHTLASQVVEALDRHINWRPTMTIGKEA
jgi:hypothetical protein